MTSEVNRGQLLSVQRHLDVAGDRYLDSINGQSPESLMTTLAKLEPLSLHLKSPGNILSVGVGQGEEVHALRLLYPEDSVNLLGLDISEISLRRAQSRSEKQKIGVSFIMADATDIPLKDESVDGVVASAVLHEIYSYLPNGRVAVGSTLGSIARVLAPGGSFLLRDFAAPDADLTVSVGLKGHAIQRFYEYYRNEYRIFSSWGEAEKASLIDRKKVGDNNLPPTNNGQVMLSLADLSEFVLHYRNFWNDWQKGHTDFGDQDWKEINESYLIPSPINRNVARPMTPSEYFESVIAIGNRALKDKSMGFKCIMKNLAARDDTVDFLMQHVDLGPQTRVLLGQATRKLEAVFEKNEI